MDTHVYLLPNEIRNGFLLIQDIYSNLNYHLTETCFFPGLNQQFAEITVYGLSKIDLIPISLEI